MAADASNACRGDPPRSVPPAITPQAVSAGSGAERCSGRQQSVEDRCRGLTALRATAGAAIDMGRLVEVVLGNGKVHLAIVDAQLTLRYVDPAWRALHGHPDGRSWPDYFAWRPAFGAEEQIQETVARLYSIARDHAHPEQPGRTLELTTVPFEDALGERLVAVFEADVTDARHAEEAVRRSEERYRRLFELESDAIVLMEYPSRRILAANQAAETLYGTSREELLTMTGLDLSAEPAASAWSMRDCESAIAQRLHRRRNGEIFPAEITVRHWDEDGRSVCLAAVRDVSARVRAEKALDESARRLTMLLNNLPGYVFRGRFVPSWRLEYLSDGFQDVTGYPAADFVGEGARRVESLILPEDYEPIERDIERVLSLGGTYAVRYRIRHASGEVRWLLTKCQGVFEGGTLAAAEGFTTDIMDLRRAEEERERLQAQLLQAHKTESIGRLAGGVAHDFNNLLTVILGACEMIEDGPCDAAVLADVRQIRQAGQRARSLTRQLLAFGRRQLLNLQRTNLSQLTREHLDMLRRLIGEDIRIETVLASDLWDVHCDASQMVQVLINLAANARDAMPQGGILTLRTENLTVSHGGCAPLPGLTTGDYVLLAVSDTGCGMDDETVGHAFEPFYTTKDVGAGSGLGLPMVHGIISQHGGQIGLDSAPGKGTHLRIVLPRRTGAADCAAVPKAAARPPIHGDGKTVLLVEDDAEVRRMVRAFIARQGYHVESAGTPSEARHLAERMGRVDLLVCDVVLPEMNGRELYAQLAARWPGLRVLFISGYPGSTLSDRGTMEAGYPLLPKPFTAQELGARIHAAFATSVGSTVPHDPGGGQTVTSVADCVEQPTPGSLTGCMQGSGACPPAGQTARNGP